MYMSTNDKKEQKCVKTKGRRSGLNPARSGGNLICSQLRHSGLRMLRAVKRGTYLASIRSDSFKLSKPFEALV